MTLWLIIMWTALVLTGIALVYVSNRVCQFGCIKCLTKDNEKSKAMIGGGIVFVFFAIVTWCLNFVNAIVCIVYFALAWLICDLFLCFISRLRGKPFEHYYAGGLAVVISLSALSYGWYLNHHVWQTEYNLSTDKNVKPLKIALFADSHIGTTFDADGFAKHMDRIQQQNPDLIIIAGDFVDDNTTRDDMLSAVKTLGNMNTKYGVYFVFGNHDKGYYAASYRGFSGEELVTSLKQNNIHVLQDQVKLIDNDFYIIGRRDFSVVREHHGQRQTMLELLKNLDEQKYVIVVDHQPNDYENQAASEVDLVLSGHTHGGQLFPFNYVGQWIGVNDQIYGHKKYQKTDFFVTSGLSNWALKFKTGTKSEYVIINLQPQK